MGISDLLRDSALDGVDVDLDLDAASPVFAVGDDLPDEPLVIQEDKKPAHRTRRGRAKVTPELPKTKAGKAELEGKIRDNLAMMLGMPAAAWSMRDPHCGGTLFAQSDAIIEAMVPIILRNPSMLKFFTSAGGGFMDYVALATALWPVGKTIYSHHVRGVEPGSDGSGVNLDLSGFAAPGFASAT